MPDIINLEITGSQRERLTKAHLLDTGSNGTCSPGMSVEDWILHIALETSDSILSDDAYLAS